ncbi:hypothetical protein ABIF66_008851 [Bradyrhizobium japonicum]|uniref:hypothetical protein n=1 Tax=Bradyrhizobium liaoningense TaxID=43992 RepID=UPI001BAC4EFC|nr:hypothetical protein [Bradyrhizobium liaoningense]MBR1070233.1 hypothetical protein [Bradyrhizobium liaoningense]
MPTPQNLQLTPINPRQPKHRLPPGPGRSKGSVNKVCRDLKLGIVDAAIALGEDGEGRGGLQGYLQFLGRNHVKAFSHLLGKVLPLTVGADGPGISTVVAINITSVPAGLNSDGSPQSSPIIEHTPQPPMSADDSRRTELSRLPRAELLRLAGVSDEDDS